MVPDVKISNEMRRALAISHGMGTESRCKGPVFSPFFPAGGESFRLATPWLALYHEVIVLSDDGEISRTLGVGIAFEAFAIRVDRL